MATSTEVKALSFLTLLETHQQLDELFLCHQESLLTFDLDKAARQLEAYERELHRHMEQEEDWLLPVFERAKPIAGGAVELFTGEHKKMREFVARFKETLTQLKGRPAELKRRVIELFDQQALFKHLVEHHDSREETILYPTLDRVTSEQERGKLLTRCTSPRASIDRS